MFAIYSTTFILISREYFHIEEDFRESRFQNQKIGSYTHPPHYEKFFILNQLDALNLAFRTIPQPGMPEYLIENIHKVALRFPWMPIQKKYILTLLLNGNSQEAERQIKVFRAMHGNRAYSELLSTIKETTNNKHPSN